VGGRTFGGILWIGGILFGGILAYLITSLAWLARGSAEGILTYTPPVNASLLTPEEDDLVRSYLKDASFITIPASGRNDLIPKLEQSLEEFDQNTVSSSYWAIILVLHVFFSLYMAGCRTLVVDYMGMARGTVAHVYMSVILTLCVLMPLLGQYKYWTQIIGGMIKAVSVTMFGCIAGPLLVYVQSAHDNTRLDLADAFVKVGRYLSVKASVLHASCMGGTALDACGSVQAEEDCMKTFAGGVSSVQDLMKATLKVEGDIACCSLEPPWPMVTSQVGADFRLYAQALLVFQRLIGSLNAYGTTSKNFAALVAARGALDEEEEKIFGVVQHTTVGVSTALQDMAAVLKHMPVFGVCSGNSLSWRPKGSEYWNSFLGEIYDAIQGSMVYLKASACKGIASALEPVQMDDSPQDLEGIQLLLISICETMIEECITLEHSVAKALGITDIAYQHILDSLHEQHAPGVDETSKASNSVSCWSSIKSFPRNMYDKWEDICGNAYLLALVGIVKQATSYYTYKLELTRFVSSTWTVLRGKWAHPKELKSILQRRDMQFYIKFFIAVNLSFIAIILIIWLRYGNSASAIHNATSMASWYGSWQPEYFLTATVICLQKQVEMSVVKAFLRCSMIAFGGVLGYVTMLNGYLASNPYFIFFMGVLMNGFFGLFSIYGMDFRYSLFLTVYTWNGVVLCQYTGVCCQAGTVLEFGGKTVSTCLGAVWALIFTILIKPLYTSEVIFSIEKDYLMGVLGYFEKSFHSGATLQRKNTIGSDDDPDGEKGTIFEKKLVYSVRHADRLNEVRGAVNAITKLRIDSLKAFGKEMTLNSLDKREVVFWKVTILPLPQSLNLIRSRLVPFGGFVSASSKSSYSYLLGQSASEPTTFFLEHMLEPTDSVIAAAKSLASSIAASFDNHSSAELIELRDSISQGMAELQKARDNVRHVFCTNVQQKLLEMSTCSSGDLKCLVWYQFLMAASRELQSLAAIMCKDDRCLERDTYTSFFTAWYTRR
jgi:hypothetical protein